jgi:lipid II:glycine glycyltransferase (peptidoglycan interpeptide bridge formation enzyme)
LTAKDIYRTVADQLPLFFRPWWLEAVHQGSWDVAVLEQQGHVLAVWPYTLEKKAVFTILRNPQLTPYLGPYSLKEAEPGSAQIRGLWQQIPKTDFLQWSCMPGIQTGSFFKQENILSKKKRTFQIDLSQSLETTWSGIHPKRKNDIRKAQEDLQLTQGFMDVPAFTGWHSKSFSGKGKQYPYDAAFLTRVIRAAGAEQSSRAYTATDKQGQIAGQIWLVFDHHTMYYLLSAAPEQAHRGAIALLIWAAIQEAKRMNLRTFDFEGSMDEGIAFFFRRFGGIEMNYEEYAMTNSVLWKLKQKMLG